MQCGSQWDGQTDVVWLSCCVLRWCCGVVRSMLSDCQFGIVVARLMLCMVSRMMLCVAVRRIPSGFNDVAMWLPRWHCGRRMILCVVTNVTLCGCQIDAVCGCQVDALHGFQDDCACGCQDDALCGCHENAVWFQRRCRVVAKVTLLSLPGYQVDGVCGCHSNALV